MSGFGKALSTVGLALGVAFILSASDQKAEAQQRGPANAPADGNAPSSIPWAQQIGDALLRHQQGARQGYGR